MCFVFLGLWRSALFRRLCCSCCARRPRGLTLLDRLLSFPLSWRRGAWDRITLLGLWCLAERFGRWLPCCRRRRHATTPHALRSPRQEGEMKRLSGRPPPLALSFRLGFFLPKISVSQSCEMKKDINNSDEGRCASRPLLPACIQTCQCRTGRFRRVVTSHPSSEALLAGLGLLSISYHAPIRALFCNSNKYDFSACK